MRNGYILFLSVIFFGCGQGETKIEPSPAQQEYAMVIHGGAGAMAKGTMTPEKEAEFLKSLENALAVGNAMLAEGKEGLDVVVEVIKLMENDSIFNSGKGAVYTSAGEHELDASIMGGQTKKAGAVGGVKTIKNPIMAARAVMDHSEHVFMVGPGAEAFAKTQGLEMVENSYFDVQSRYEGLIRAQANEVADPDKKHGTVGCVVLDKNGNLAAGTSTGGMTNKKFGRIGDSPIIGAGTYADNKTCAISSTGHGEYFIRYTIARDVAARMEFGGEDIQTAADSVIHGTLSRAGGTGGLVGLDAYGTPVMPFNTDGMFRGYTNPDTTYFMIYQEDK